MSEIRISYAAFSIRKVSCNGSRREYGGEPSAGISSSRTKIQNLAANVRTKVNSELKYSYMNTIRSKSVPRIENVVIREIFGPKPPAALMLHSPLILHKVKHAHEPSVKFCL